MKRLTSLLRLARGPLVVGSLFGLIILFGTVPNGWSSSGEGALSQARQRELVRLVRLECGACHGLSLQGGLGPALTPEALRDRPAEGLVETILRGRSATPMPPFSSFVDESEARWIVERLRTGFPELSY